MLYSTWNGDSRGEAEQQALREARTAEVVAEESSLSSRQWGEYTGGLAEEKTGDRVSSRPSGELLPCSGWKSSRVAVKGADLEEEGAAELGWRISSLKTVL